MRRLAAAPLLAVLLLTACGGGDDTTDADSSTSAAATSAAESAQESIEETVEETPEESSEPEATALASETPAVDGDNPVSGSDFCEFLAAEAPELESVGSPIGALARFAGDFAVWVSEHPDQAPRTAADLDAASGGECPVDRDRVLEALGGDSFQQALGG